MFSQEVMGSGGIIQISFLISNHQGGHTNFMQYCVKLVGALLKTNCLHYNSSLL